MIQPVTKERWELAQKAERKTHTKSLEDGIHHYRIAYGHNFRYLGIDPDSPKIGIIEIGCADFPALRYFWLTECCTIIEPMPSDLLKSFCYDKHVDLIQHPFESDEVLVDPRNEIWMFNVLQHVADPEKFIAKAKQAKTIRYFEPIETEITDYHPHSFNFSDFENWFGRANKYYNRTDLECFHNGPCCYGVWKNENV